MSKLRLHRVPIRKQPPFQRIYNFSEVSYGYSVEEAISEAERCTGCKKCIPGCPVLVDIPAFIKKIVERDFQAAIEIIKTTNSLPAICGRVCPQETQCEILCPLGKKGEPIAIGRLERFVADWERENLQIKLPSIKKNGIKIAVVGSGPAGLTCASDLAKLGYSVDIFESLHKPGGVLRYGIPEFRLPKKILDFEVEYIKSLGVNIFTNVLVGKTVTVPQLFLEGYKAVFIGTGAGLPNFMNIPGENLIGVYSANEFLTRVNLMEAHSFPHNSDTPVNIGDDVIIVGAGNVSFDSARVALRLGAKNVYIVYRRSRNEMPARLEEITNAEEEGIKFHLLTLPVEIVGDKKVEGVRCIRMELGAPDESGRRRPIPVKGSEFFIKADTVIIAIGQSPNPLLPQTLPELKMTKHGTIVTNERMETSIKGVFAGGDIVTGAATVILAMGMAKTAALAIHQSQTA